MTKEQLQSLTPAEGLHKLKEGNFRFLNNMMRTRDSFSDIEATKDGQQPFAAIVSCMDSRVPNETVMDLGIGEAFSVRIAGNVITNSVLGSLEFAAAVIGSKIIVVMGHSGCGAIKGACDGVELGNLTSVLARIRPAVEMVRDVPGERNSSNKPFVEAVAELNARFCTQQITEQSRVIKDLVLANKLGIVPAMYDVATGKVRFLDDGAIGLA